MQRYGRKKCFQQKMELQDLQVESYQQKTRFFQFLFVRLRGCMELFRTTDICAHANVSPNSPNCGRA